MNIIKAPNHKCEYCGCEYEFDSSDFKEEKIYFGSYQPNPICIPQSKYHCNTYVECPVCGNKFVFNTKDIAE